MTFFLNLVLWRLHHPFASGRSEFIDSMRRQVAYPLLPLPSPFYYHILLFIIPEDLQHSVSGQVISIGGLDLHDGGRLLCLVLFFSISLLVLDFLFQTVLPKLQSTFYPNRGDLNYSSLMWSSGVSPNWVYFDLFYFFRKS